MFAFLPVFIAAGFAAFPVEVIAADLSAEQVLQRYFEVDLSSPLRNVTMEATFIARVPKLSRDGMVVAKRTINEKGDVHYETLRSEGDKAILKDVIARLMTTEMETPPQAYAQIAINRQHYKFKHKGVQEKDGRLIHVFELNPRKKRAGLFKGELWIDQETGLAIREAGRLVKSPSVFLRKVEFVREYVIQDSRAMPLRTRSLSDTRFWGKAEITIDYGNWQSLGASSQVADAAEALRPRN